MFNQSPLTGPGTASLTSHTMEILIMLLVAFTLGYLLARALAAKARFQVQQLESAVSGMSAQNLDLSSKLSKAHGDNETLRRRLASAETEATKLRAMSGDLEYRLGNTGPRTGSAPITVSPAPITTPPTTLADAPKPETDNKPS